MCHIFLCMPLFPEWYFHTGKSKEPISFYFRSNCIKINLNERCSLTSDSLLFWNEVFCQMEIQMACHPVLFLSLYGHTIYKWKRKYFFNSSSTYKCSIPSDPRTMSISTSVIIANRIKFCPPKFSLSELCKFDLKQTYEYSSGFEKMDNEVLSQARTWGEQMTDFIWFVYITYKFSVNKWGEFIFFFVPVE